MELKTAVQRGDLVPAEAVAREWEGICRTIRAEMLRVPKRAAARLPHLTPQDVSAIDSEVRAALTELVDKTVANFIDGSNGRQAAQPEPGVEVMPDSKAKVAEFCKLCAQISIVYDLYRSLFVAHHSRFELYNSIAPFCFGDLSAFLVEYVLLQFSKITDPAKTGKNFNLTTNYILQELCWPEDTCQKLEQINARLMRFRKYIEPARSKRVAHIDLHAQLIQRQSLGGFPEDADEEFLKDLQAFAQTANEYFNPGDHLSIRVAMSNDTYRLVRALEKSVIFDRCSKCDAGEQDAAVLDYETVILTSGKKLP